MARDVCLLACTAALYARVLRAAGQNLTAILEFEENHGRNVLRAKYEVDTNMAALGGPGSPATGQHEVTDRIGAAARL